MDKLIEEIKFVSYLSLFYCNNSFIKYYTILSIQKKKLLRLVSTIEAKTDTYNLEQILLKIGILGFILILLIG